MDSKACCSCYVDLPLSALPTHRADTDDHTTRGIRLSPSSAENAVRPVSTSESDCVSLLGALFVLSSPHFVELSRASARHHPTWIELDQIRCHTLFPAAAVLPAWRCCGPLAFLFPLPLELTSLGVPRHLALYIHSLPQACPSPSSDPASTRRRTRWR